MAGPSGCCYHCKTRTSDMYLWRHRTERSMRLALALALFVSSALAFAQADLWKQVNPQPNGQLGDAQISPARLEAIHKLMRAHSSSIGWTCEGDDLTELLKGLTFHTIPLSDREEVLLAEAGAGCARGGQGSNGAMWLIRFDGETPVLIATPQGGFNGWLCAIPPATSHGLRDVVLGWHMSADQGSLNYFRFDGQSYHSVGSASYTIDDNDHWQIVPMVPNPK